MIIKNISQLFTGFLLCLLILCGQVSKAQIAGTPYINPAVKPSAAPCLNSSTAGTDFFLTYGIIYNGPNIDLDQLTFLLNIAALNDTQVTITLPNPSQSYTFTVPANTIKQINFGAYEGLAGNPDVRGRVYLYGLTGVISNRTIHITSDKPISVYNYEDFSNGIADAGIVVPTSIWGNEYYNISYQANVLGNSLNPVYNSEIVIANQTNTVITLPDNSTRTLNTGDVFVYNIDRLDLTGRHITSNKPVGYLANVACTNVPAGRDFSDNLFEQMMPVNQWGTNFFVPNIKPGGNDMNTVIRIMASQDNTQIFYDNATKTAVAGSTSVNSGGTLNKGQWAEIQITGTTENIASWISGTKPIAVTAYMVGAKILNGQQPTDPIPRGDPAMTWIPPFEQATPKVLVAPFAVPTVSMNHSMLISVKTSDRASTAVNGAPLPATGWVSNASSGYSFYRYAFNNSTDLGKSFRVENLVSGVLVSVYGTGVTNAISYYYNGGSGACVIP